MSKKLVLEWSGLEESRHWPWQGLEHFLPPNVYSNFNSSNKIAIFNNPHHFYLEMHLYKYFFYLALLWSCQNCLFGRLLVVLTYIHLHNLSTNLGKLIKCFGMLLQRNNIWSSLMSNRTSSWWLAKFHDIGTCMWAAWKIRDECHKFLAK